MVIQYNGYSATEYGALLLPEWNDNCMFDN